MARASAICVAMEIAPATDIAPFLTMWSFSVPPGMYSIMM